MRSVFKCLLFLLRVVSWPVVVGLVVIAVSVGIMVWREGRGLLANVAFVVGVIPGLVITPFLVVGRMLWGIFRLFQRRFAEGWVVLLVGFPLGVGACGALFMVAGTVLWILLTGPDGLGKTFAFPEERPVALPIDGRSGAAMPLVWLMKQPDAAERLDALVASNPEVWSWEAEPIPTLFWKHKGKTWRLKATFGECYNGLWGPSPVDAEAVLADVRPYLGEFRIDSPKEPVFLRVDCQPGMYELTSTLGRPLLLTVTTSPGGQVLSGLERKPLPAEGGRFTIHEGDWEDYYGVEVKLHDAETNAPLFRRVYLLDGWMH